MGAMQAKKAGFAFALSGALAVACSVGLPDHPEEPGTPAVPTSAEAGLASDASVLPPLGDAPYVPPTGDGAIDGALRPPSCPPAPVTSFNKTPWITPQPLHRNLCNLSQAQIIVECLFTSAPSVQQCDQFFGSYVNDACISCAISSPVSQKAGPIIDTGSTYYTNTPGCIAGLSGDGSAAGCGAKYSTLLDCEEAACAHCKSDQEWFECAAAADTGACLTYSNDASCRTTYATTCLAAKTYVQEALDLVKLFCMP